MNARQTRNRCTLEAIASLPNLFIAAAKGRRGKSRRTDVEEWWMRPEVKLLALRDAVLSGTYLPGAYHFFEIHEPKRRVIAAAPFRDRVVHHALCNYLAPVLDRCFIARSFSCQIGKGTRAAPECWRQLTNRHRFVLKCDVRKFFPNLDPVILFNKLKEEVRCGGAVDLIQRILVSFRTGVDVPAPISPGDDPVEASARPRGVLIGNLTSQLWGNFYLDGLDHWMTEEERHGDYLRYTNDFLVFGNDKARLWELREGIVAQLAAVRLKLAEPKSRLLATREGVPFCGFRFLPDLRPRILGATKRRFEARRYHLFERAPLKRLTQAVFAWYQFSREGNSEGLRRAYAKWPPDARLKRRQRKHRVLRGGSWNGYDPGNFSALYRRRLHPDLRFNFNYGFRCGLFAGVSPKAGR